MLLRRRLDRRPLAGLGLPGPVAGLRSFTLGTAVTAVTAAAAVLAFVAGTTADWLRWRPVDWSDLLAFLVLNTVLALLLEAVPEELIFRGYIYRSLNGPLRRWTAFLGCVGLFATSGLPVSTVSWAAAWLLGGETSGLSLAPANEDPVAYVTLLVIFGAALLLVRIWTGSLWACVGLHLVFLTANRIVLFGEDREAGWSAELLTPDAVLLVPAYLVLTAVAFLVLARITGRRIG
ncbi:MAG: CPBP family glutamic-type intramembrane protease [Pseudonocardiaceae bacterium]